VQTPAPYELVEPLGAGAMGEVWKAWDARLCRSVAIKFLGSGLAGDSAAQQRFQREVLAASALNHPHILTVYDCGEIEGRPYLVSEFIQGEDLRQALSRGPVAVEQAIEWARQALAGLEAAHAAGILHRDLKPENLVVRADGYLKIVDFGLAKLLHEADNLTGSQVVGTLHYMAPEQLQGEPLDGRADLFSLAAVVYEMVTGQPAFGGKALPDIVTAVLTRHPEIPTSVLSTWLARGLQKRAEDRFASAEEMRRALPLTSGLQRHAVPTVAQETSLLVLPFVAAAENDRELSEGISEGVISQLAKQPGLRVIGPSTAQKFRGQEARAAAFQVNAHWCLEGQLRRSGSRIRLTVSLTEAADGFQLWSERLDAEMKDLFDLEDELTERLLRSLREGALVGRQPRDRLSSEALQAYHHALQEVARIRLEPAVASLRKVLAESPNFAPALARLSQCIVYYALRLGPKLGRDHAQEAAALARRALEVDPDNADALVAQSMLATSTFAKDLPEGRRLLRRALAANPGHGEAASRLAHCNLLLGNVVAAEMLARRAVQIDPLRPFHYLWLCLALQAQGRLLDAAEVANRSLRLIPDSPAVWVNVLLLDAAQGRIAEARQFLQHLRTQLFDFTSLLSGATMVLDAVEGKPIDVDARPWESDSRAALDVKLTIARALATAGHHDKSVGLLEECAADGLRCFPLLVNDPLLSSVQTQPRFLQLTAGMRDACRQDPEFDEPLQF
jgi:eukaryotic-like serine/threonine-protein kinase